MSRILVVDDEPEIRRTLGINLRVRGYDVDLAEDGEAALTLAARHYPDAVVLDLGLPGIHGVDVIEGLRGWSRVPIVVLSARDAEGDKVAALDAGDDEVRLTPTEWNLVEVLVRNAGKLVSSRQLLHEVWGPGYERETHYLRVFMAHVRRKLEPEPSHPRYFQTEPGMGYRFKPS